MSIIHVSNCISKLINKVNIHRLILASHVLWLLPRILFIDFFKICFTLWLNFWLNFTLLIVMIFVISQNYFSIRFSYFSAHYHVLFHVFLLVEHIFCFQYPQVILQEPSMVVKFLSPFVHKSPLILPLNLVIVWLSSETVKKNIPLELQLFHFAYYLRDHTRSLTAIWILFL